MLECGSDEARCERERGRKGRRKRDGGRGEGRGKGGGGKEGRRMLAVGIVE
jgi:hypothetical protein